MAIVARFHPTNLTPELYQQAVDRMNEVAPSPDGLDYHVCFAAEGGLVVSEIWDSREQMDAFGEKLMPVLSEVGIEMAGEPEIFEVHNIQKR